MLKFQFTHPGRGATLDTSLCCSVVHVSIHAPREGCDRLALRVVEGIVVSIHAPREGCDVYLFGYSPPNSVVSIHAPREGCDIGTNISKRDPDPFQFTHPGRGATVHSWPSRSSRIGFNSRTPGGVRLLRGFVAPLSHYVSIHAPREGCDSVVQSCVL